MIRIHVLLVSLITGILAIAMAPAAGADAAVTYEVASSDVAAANIEYFDLSGRQVLENVALPWRTNATVANPHSNDATLRANWQPAAARYKWVTVRVYTRGSLLCETTLDEGQAACYGSGPYYLPLPPYQACPPPVLSCGGTYRP
ncbi:MmpS family transport accessory protein [Mycobacterium avium]|uniref:MmpS family transport accessory protein n=1 Tax=Mycobacterium avium TaxID=1764 RepID=UPI001CC80607|nr:MmpS family transport accessory protein [Mycobacterium avium]